VSASLVLTVIGPDRTGLVESLAQTIADHDGSWVESRMAQLAGKFAGILRVRAPEERAADLRRALLGLEAAGLRVVVEAADSEGPLRLPGAPRLDLLGSDRPGIIREISRTLAARGVNVNELNTECFEAPMSGEQMFRASAELGLPEGLSVDDVRGILEGLAEDLMVDITVD